MAHQQLYGMGGWPLARCWLLTICAMAAMLILSNAILIWIRFGMDVSADGPFGFIYYRLILNSEANIATWFASTLLVLCAFALVSAAIAQRRQRHRDWKYWFVLACVFVVLSVDETASLHENLTVPAQRIVDTDAAIGTNAWVVIVLPLVLIFGAFQIRWLLRLPRAIAAGFVMSGAIFVGGAAGVEVLSGVARDQHGFHSIQFAVISLVEEGIEITGLCVFLTYLLRHLAAISVVDALTQNTAPK